MSYSKICLFCLCLLQSFGIFAQNFIDSVNQLKVIEVMTQRLSNFSSGNKTETMDSALLKRYSTSNLADLLANESQIFIKSYGLGSLATTSFRGAGACHTAVLWNGFNLESPLIGMLDLSLVPVNFPDAISIQYGGSSALWGSGAVGGAIHINNNAKFNSGITTYVNLSAGNFENYGQQASVEFSRKKFVSSIKLFNTSAKNNFQYHNIFSTENGKVTQSNAELRSSGLLSENYLLIKENQKINLFFWYQHTDRNIPPTMLQLTNHSNQIDNSYRVTSEWKYDKLKTTNYLRAAYFNESLTYSDEIYGLADTNNSQSFIIETESKIKLNAHNLINVGINNTYAKAVASNLPNQPRQNRTAFFASFLYTSKNEKLRANISFRQEIIKNKLIPFTYSTGTDYRFIKCLSLKTTISKVYRIPSFNDLYWSPGGNLKLLPESGYSEEIGLKLNLKNNNVSFTSEATVFNRNMKNWIIWLPEISYWSPQNIMTVWSRGMETNSMLSLKINKVNISFSVLTNYVVSTNQQAKSANDASIDKQLIYVPMYSGNAKTGIEYKSLTFSYRHNYTGYRYTSTDNTQYIKPFDLGSLYFSYKMVFKNISTSFYVQMNNVWNKEYQVMLNRAMPQRNFNGGISIEFNKPNNN